MLRTLDEAGGIAVYSRGLTSALLACDRDNDYFLFYRDIRHVGSYSEPDNATEIVVSGSSKVVWDQIAIPIACRRHDIDVLLHPKFTVPFLAPCKTVMVVHGADWFVPEFAHFYDWLDIRYIRTVMPFYFRRSARVISVSKLTTSYFQSALQLPPDKIETIYFAPAKHFRRIEDQETLQQVRDRYALPKRFILTLTKRDGDRRKNLPGLLRGYELYHQRADSPASLVIGGKDCHLFRSEYQIPDDRYGADVLFPGFIDQRDLPAVYSQAAMFLYPSSLEAFPIPLTEAMACGTPIVTSNVNGLKEIAGDAAHLVDPSDPTAIAQGIERVLEDPNLQDALVEKGFARSKEFDWQICADRTLSLLHEVHSSKR